MFKETNSLSLYLCMFFTVSAAFCPTAQAASQETSYDKVATDQRGLCIKLLMGPTGQALAKAGAAPTLHPLANKIYRDMTYADGWWGSKYFNNRGFGPRQTSSKAEYAELVNFIFDKLNDPKTFSEFINILLQASGASTTQPEVLPARESILKVLRNRLNELGFQVEQKSNLPNRAFLALIAEGIVVEELPGHLDTNGHGLDSHLVQMAYIAPLIDQKFGPGSALAYYKFMGATDYFIWAELFENPGADHIGNPSVVHGLIEPLGLK